ncbi:GDSL esterase/lipase At4g16230-like [Papaver somniferum]|uniref:GDSL esterase/lipase At4g16230-like n=1 Tax=Papaver somniferum TaxID=3469 RepID=UPI000E6F53A0|nr:GDSL esterase/lipase At4g16230-like [Papaver somniferum]
MIRSTSSYSNCHHAHILLTNVLMVLTVFTLSCSSTNSATPLESHDMDEPRAMYIFGDSLVDAGNINYINPLTKNNNYPNGIDFPSGKRFTGRSTNGRTVVDIIGEELGVKDYIPPYLDPTTVGDVVLRGVNYACGGAGILCDTGAILRNTINMDAQVDNFANTRNYIISNLGGSGSKILLEKALFAVVVGSNDFTDNYFTPVISIPKQMLESPEIFVDSMISKFRLQLTRLYEMDARKIAVANVGPVGCIPIERALYTTGDSCRSAMNDAAMLFNKKLKSLLVELNANLVESKFVYVDSYKVLSHIFDNYQSYGFEDFKTGCVKLLADPTLGMVSPAPLVCKDRSKHVFWDLAHPTEATYAIFAKKVLEDRGSTYTYPMNVRQLYYS